MKTRLTRLAAGAGICLALLTMAAPTAMAQNQDPGAGGTAGTVVAQNEGPDVSSIALGALGGIAFAGVGLGITLGVQRHRDHAAMPSA
jgi:hypothetical protein